MTTAEQCATLRAELLARGDSEEQASAAAGVLLFAVGEGAAIDRIDKLENPDITGKGLLGVLDAHNERIGKLEKANDARAETALLDVRIQRQAVLADVDHENRLKALEEAREEPWERMNDMIGVVEERATGWNGRIAYLEKLMSVPEQSGRPRLVRAAFDEEWAPSLAYVPNWVKRVAVDKNGKVFGYENDLEPLRENSTQWWPNTSSANGSIELGVIDLEALKLDWRTTERKVVR